jgi:hypothetical protein
MLYNSFVVMMTRFEKKIKTNKTKQNLETKNRNRRVHAVRDWLNAWEIKGAAGAAALYVIS